MGELEECKKLVGVIKQLAWAREYLVTHGDIDNAVPLIEEAGRILFEMLGADLGQETADSN